MDSKAKNKNKKLHTQNKIINEPKNKSPNKNQEKNNTQNETQNKKEKQNQNNTQNETQNKKEKQNQNNTQNETQNKIINEPKNKSPNKTQNKTQNDTQNKTQNETQNKKQNETQNQTKTQSEKKNEDNFNTSRLSFFKPIGFENSLKENNCFVSVVFHALFHFTQLKDQLIKLNISSPKLIVEVISLLSSYQKLNKDKKNLDNIILNPENFRNELAKVTKNKLDFKKNEQGDPIELLNYLFNSLHEFMTSNNILSNENCKCLIHELFYINIKEISICKNCKFEKSLKYDLNYFMQFLNVDIILNNIEKKKKFSDLNEKIFKYAKIFKTQSSKCEKCSKLNLKNSIVCDSIGKYFIINLGFDKSDLKMEDLCYLYIMIGREFNVKDLYDYKKDTKLYFLGMILYWSSHYICLFFSPNLEKFILYDDKITKNYSSWKDIISNFILNKYQPVALIYGEYEENKLKKLPLFNIDETFYNNILNNAIKLDKEQIYNKNIENLAIDENEWICNNCTCINKMNNDTCSACNTVNEVIKEMNQLKYEELKKIKPELLSKEERDFVNYIEAKNNDLIKVDDIKKWVCHACGCKTNLEIDTLCKMCGTERMKNSNLNNNNNKKKNVKKKEDDNNNNHILDNFLDEETFNHILEQSKNNDILEKNNQINNHSNHKNKSKDKNNKNELKDNQRKKNTNPSDNKNKNNEKNKKQNETEKQNNDYWICKNCGNKDICTMNYCTNCYKSRDKSNVICYVCESSNIKDGKCKKCKNVVQWICQKCNTEYSLNNKKCLKCGTEYKL